MRANGESGGEQVCPAFHSVTEGLLQPQTVTYLTALTAFRLFGKGRSDTVPG